MPKFMFLGSYTAEGLDGLRKDSAAGREAAVSTALQSVGGRLEAMYYALGDHDVILIADLPHNVSVERFALVVSEAGFVRLATHPIFTIEEIDQALRLRADYRPPGAAPAP